MKLDYDYFLGCEGVLILVESAKKQFGALVLELTMTNEERNKKIKSKKGKAKAISDDFEDQRIKDLLEIMEKIEALRKYINAIKDRERSVNSEFVEIPF